PGHKGHIKNLYDNPDEVKNLVYVSRRLANGRRLINEEELLLSIVELGFHVYYLEEMSFSDQVRIFHQAQVVIGPHGGGFSNIIFCRPRTIVIDIQPPEWQITCFEEISSAFGLQYYKFLGVNMGWKSKVGNPKVVDIVVDVEKLKAKIHEVIG
ncbi:MAG: glycosyltransferase family 61 protein, partial [Cyclobacteriaceae bacterium]